MKTPDHPRPALSAAMLQAQYRVQQPNAQPREILIIPLGENSAAISRNAAEQSYRHARFLPHAPFGEAWRPVLASSEIDLVVLLAEVGEHLAPAVAIGETCFSNGIKVSGILLHRDPNDIAGLSTALRSLRPWTQTLAVISEADYIPGLLHALGA